MPYDTTHSGVFDARFSDGKTAAAKDVRVTLSARGIIIHLPTGGSDLIWPYGALKTAEPLSPHAIDALVSYTYQPGASLFVPHGGFARALAQAAPHLTTRAARRRAAVPWLWAAAAVVAITTVISLSSLTPARTLASMMPDAVRRSLGEHTVRSITNDRPACVTPDGSRAVAAMTERLAQGLPKTTPFEVVVVDWDLVNAFATPGDRVVLTKGLIAKAESAEEVAGVLAHEMGHATLLHPETSLVRVIGMSAAVELLLGGGSGTLANIGVLLTQLSYTRQAEAEADEAALALMERAGIPAKGLGDFFRRVNKMEGNGEGKASGGDSAIIDMLRTHPPTTERIARVDQANSYPTRPVLSASQWQALKAICGSETTTNNKN